MHWFLKFILGMKFYMFRTIPLSIVRSFSLYTQQWYMPYRFVDSLRAELGWSCSQAVSKPVWHIPLLYVQWKTPDDGQRNCPKHVEFLSKNKFEKSVHLVGFITKMSPWSFLNYQVQNCHFRSRNVQHYWFRLKKILSGAGSAFTDKNQLFLTGPQVWNLPVL